MEPASPMAAGPPRIRAALLALGLAATAAAAQVGEAPRLLELSGPVTVRYTPGSLDRAARLQRRFAPLVDRFEAWNGSPTSLVLLLLSRHEWESSGVQLDYGLPGRLGSNILVLGAWGDAGTVELWEGLLGASLPQPADTAVRGSPREAASLVPGDLLGEVESARMMLELAGVFGDRSWIPEVIAHSVVISQRAKGDRRRLDELAGFYRSLGRAPRRLPMSSYRSGLSLADWLWFQGRFFEGALTLMDQKGADAAKALLKMARKRGGRVTSAELLERFEGLADWLATSFAGPG